VTETNTQIDPVAQKKVSGFLVRGQNAFKTLATLAPQANAKLASLDPNVARKGARAAYLCNAVANDLTFFAGLMGIDPKFVQGFPAEQADDFAGQWLTDIQPQAIQSMMAQGLNPIVVTEQTPRTVEFLLGQIDRNVGDIEALLAEATVLESAEGSDDPADAVDPALAKIFGTIQRVRTMANTIRIATNKLALDNSDSDSDAIMCAEVQFTLTRSMTTVRLTEEELGLNHEYVAKPPKQINRFLVAWGKQRQRIADSAFSQGINGEVFLTAVPVMAQDRLDLVEATLKDSMARVPAEALAAAAIEASKEDEIAD